MKDVQDTFIGPATWSGLFISFGKNNHSSQIIFFVKAIQLIWTNTMIIFPKDNKKYLFYN